MMTDIKSYFPSPEKGVAQEASPLPARASVEVNVVGVGAGVGVGVGVGEEPSASQSSQSSQSPIACVVKTARPDSKLILQNMEEVLNSVKKKHRQKHRRKREQKKLAQQMEAEAAEAAANGGEVGRVVVIASGDNVDRHAKSSRKHKRPLQEKAADENGRLLHGSKEAARQHAARNPKTPQKTANGSILKHFAQTPKKHEQHGPGEDGDTDNVVEVVSVVSPVKSVKPKSKSTNAFEVMMNARNKSIGSNTPGKEAPCSPKAYDEASVTNVKRKLMLQEWADRRGGAKRKIDEESRAVYVEQQLENRAKRLKQMLVNGNAGGAVNEKNQKTPTTTPTTKPDKQKENASGRAGGVGGTSATTSVRKTSGSARAGERATTRGRGRPRARRLSSTDTAVGPPEECATDEGTDEFLAKLSSPTKKRDSLLGYFPKKQSPKQLADKAAETTPQQQQEQQQQPEPQPESKDLHDAKAETPRRRPRRSTAKRNAKTATQDVVAEVEAEAEDIVVGVDVCEPLTVTTPASGRPKRSCAGKIRYECDPESPTKAKKERKSNPTASDAAAIDESSEVVEVIALLDDSNSLSQSELETPKKLAPLFMRAMPMPKPSPDPDALKARKKFLMSGVPDKIRRGQTRQKQHEQNYEDAFELFPRVTHVPQFDADEVVFLAVPAGAGTLKYKPEESVGAAGRIAKGKTQCCRIGTITCCSPREYRNAVAARDKAGRLSHNALELPVLPLLENKRAIIKEWKGRFERFPTYKCYNQMREKYRYFSAIDSAQDTEQVTESFVFTRRTRRSLEAQTKKFDPEQTEEDDDKPPATAPNGELLFTEKYKPLLFEQVLVNLMPVTQLRDFLSSWSNGSGAASARNSQNLEDSMDFINESNSSQSAPCNSVVLLGPVSSGKTNAVFALANELNFNVLEINAGMKRTGKKLIQELQEATQSHQIRKESSGVASSSSSALHGKAHKNLLKLSLGMQKAKKSSSSSSATLCGQSDSMDAADLAAGNSRKCLILIEDADIVFDQMDAGFTDAIYTLAASSKRPVIVVASNPNAAHLQRLMNQNTIQFSSPNVLNISKYLAVLSLLENCPVNLDDLVSLYLFNRKDLRKTQLELQFFIQSGGDRQDCRLTGVVQEEQQEALVAEKLPITSAAADAQFFASPTKRRFSEEETNTGLGTPERDTLDRADQSLATTPTPTPKPKPKPKQKPKASSGLYMHRTLFEFYTIDQNAKFRIPFPVDFRLLATNLSDMFAVSQNLSITTTAPTATTTTAATGATANGKKTRKSRSPKKAWLRSGGSGAREQPTPMAALCDFYENISVAALLGARDDSLCGDTPPLHYTDRLVPHVGEYMAHELVEKAIAVNLAAAMCPYNLFDTPKETTSLCDYLGVTVTRSTRSRHLDFEPNLRAICRSEKLRASLERRSTRFYHYLRNSAVNLCNFSTEYFDNAAEIFPSYNNNHDHHDDDSGTPASNRESAMFGDGVNGSGGGGGGGCGCGGDGDSSGAVGVCAGANADSETM